MGVGVDGGSPAGSWGHDLGSIRRRCRAGQRTRSRCARRGACGCIRDWAASWAGSPFRWRGTSRGHASCRPRFEHFKSWLLEKIKHSTWNRDSTAIARRGLDFSQRVAGPSIRFKCTDTFMLRRWRPPLDSASRQAAKQCGKQSLAQRWIPDEGRRRLLRGRIEEQRCIGVFKNLNPGAEESSQRGPRTRDPFSPATSRAGPVAGQTRNSCRHVTARRLH